MSHGRPDKLWAEPGQVGKFSGRSLELFLAGLGDPRRKLRAWSSLMHTYYNVVHAMKVHIYIKFKLFISPARGASKVIAVTGTSAPLLLSP